MYPLSKRLLDVCVAAVGLVVLLPLLVVIAAAIRISMGSPVLFRQPRPGLHGELFDLVKFRTMMVAEPGEGVESDGRRMTGLGRLLRATSLDELPGLLNVLKGEMSLVGPRPLLPEYLPLYTPEQARRHEVKPGMTGWAQVRGRNALTWEDKFRFDVWYVDHRSLLLDLRIIILTLGAVFRRSEVTMGNQPTTTPFRGSDSR